MSKKLPQISGEKMGRVLTRLGFRFKSQRGSHMKFTREMGGERVTIIVPKHEILNRGTLHNILKTAGIDTLDLAKFL